MRSGSWGTLAAYNRYDLIYANDLGAFCELMGPYNQVYVTYDYDN